MIVEEFCRVLLEGDRYIIRVFNYKIIDVYGLVRVILIKFLYSYIDVYIKEMCLKLFGVEFGGKQSLFLSWMGKIMQLNLMIKVFSFIFKKVEIDGLVYYILYRKSVVFKCYLYYKEISSSFVDLMVYREVIVQKYY